MAAAIGRTKGAAIRMTSMALGPVDSMICGAPTGVSDPEEQRAFFTAHAPDGIGLDDLSVLGPITVLKLKFAPEGYGRRLAAELWFYPRRLTDP